MQVPALEGTLNPRHGFQGKLSLQAGLAETDSSYRISRISVSPQRRVALGRLREVGTAVGPVGLKR